jgi:hypothetical protein
LAEVDGGVGLALAGEDSLVAFLHQLPRVECLADLVVVGEGEELVWGEVVGLDKGVDVAVDGEEFGEEEVVGGR